MGHHRHIQQHLEVVGGEERQGLGSRRRHDRARRHPTLQQSRHVGGVQCSGQPEGRPQRTQTQGRRRSAPGKQRQCLGINHGRVAAHQLRAVGDSPHRSRHVVAQPGTQEPRHKKRIKGNGMRVAHGNPISVLTLT